MPEVQPPPSAPASVTITGASIAPLPAPPPLPPVPAPPPASTAGLPPFPLLAPGLTPAHPAASRMTSVATYPNRRGIGRLLVTVRSERCPGRSGAAQGGACVDVGVRGTRFPA